MCTRGCTRREISSAYSIGAVTRYFARIADWEALAMSTPEHPEELFRQMVPQLSQQLTDRLLDVATEYLACMASLKALSASSDDLAVQSVIDAAAAVSDVVAGRYGDQLTTQQLEDPASHRLRIAAGDAELVAD